MKLLSALGLVSWLWSAVGLLALAAHAQSGRAPSIDLTGSVFKVEVQRAQGAYSLGSGVAVASDQVLTNCHVTRHGQAIRVVRGDRRWHVDAQAADTEHDLCLLRVPGLEATPVVLGSSTGLQSGQPVIARGYTGGQGLQHSEGEVVALHRLDQGHVIQSSNAFTSGASGGGLFDKHMQLVGILTFRLPGATEHYFSAPVEWLPRVREAPFTAVQPLPTNRLAYWQHPASAQPNFLRAAVLQREKRWDELEGLAFNWTRTEADDPQPWYLHGVALDGLRRWPESQRALERSVQLEPTSQLAWFRLGLVLTEQGQFGPARAVRARLDGLKSKLAAELGRAIDRR